MNVIDTSPTTRQANQELRGGLLAGLIAGAIIAIILFADYGPGNDLHTAASWFGLDSKSTGGYLGFLIFIILGGIFGSLFGLVMARMPNTLGRSIIVGLACALLWWIIVEPILSVLIFHRTLNFGNFLYYFVPILTYGMLLGTIYYQRIRTSS